MSILPTRRIEGGGEMSDRPYICRQCGNAVDGNDDCVGCALAAMQKAFRETREYGYLERFVAWLDGKLRELSEAI